MVRTQIYLTEEERTALRALSDRSGKKQSELIREAVDRLIHQASQATRQSVLDAAAGMWEDRTDLPDLDWLRREWDRGNRS